MPVYVKNLTKSETTGLNTIKEGVSLSLQIYKIFMNVIGQTIFCLLTAICLNILYIFVMTKAAMILVFAILVLLETLFIIIFSSFMYVALRSENPNSRYTFFIGATLIIVISLVFNCMLYCFWEELTIAVSIVNAAADFFVATKRIVYISLFYFSIGMLILVLYLLGVSMLLSRVIVDWKKSYIS